MDHKDFVLPTTAVSRTDVARLTREVVALEDYLHQAALRTGGKATAKLPKTSHILDELITANGLNLLDGAARQKLINSLTLIQQKAPIVHMSFAVDPSAAFMQKMAIWWRENVDPYVLIETGLQPTIAAGCVVRTANRQYDLSLRQHLLAESESLIKMLEVPAAL